MIQKHYNQIYEIENFLTNEEVNVLLYLIDSSSEEDWPKTVKNEFLDEDPYWSSRLLFLHQSGMDMDIMRAIDKRIALLFYHASRINQLSAIQRYKTERGMEIHKDDASDSAVKFGVVLYLNDNYEGGEIHYPDFDLTIKPKAKSLIIHPAGLAHGVLPVKQGTRYILSSFVSGDETTKVNL
jgi:hypothetical protein